ncbi:multidrug effflux MFS transporter [Shewanella sp. NIFS-20-20]|uniref:multidrug effflux MFS transporter n=1 Tax=Shewanella sp. NIFS-20-20 TaxID=2853806 RepID=UPI00210E1CEA|nr:multidrug effflux MFS transporter [Shewanella sp. NIFS-20-20]
MNTPGIKLGLLFFLAAIIAISPLAIDMYLPAMPSIASSLSTSTALVQQTMSLYLAGYAVGMLLLGPLADKWGRKYILRLGLGGFLIASLLISVCSDINHFLALRFMQAFFGAGATVVVPGYIRQIYGQHTAKGMSYVSLIMMIAPLVAPAIGAGLLKISHWPAIFALLTLYAMVLLSLTWVLTLPPMSNSPQESISYLGRYRRVFSTPGILGLIANSMLSSFAFFTYLTAAPIMYMSIIGISADHFAVLFAVNVGALMLANVINSRIVGKFGSLRILTIAASTGFIITLLMIAASLWSMTSSLMLLVPPLMLCIGMMSVNADSMVLMRFNQDSGTATAVMGTLKFGGGSLAGPLLAMAPNQLWPFPLLLCVSLLVVLSNCILYCGRKPLK